MFKVDVKKCDRGGRKGRGEGPAWVWGFDDYKSNSSVVDDQDHFWVSFCRTGILAI